jgi:6-phosphogluconate dehydrogenase
MQAIAECHGVLHRLAGLDHDRSAAIFAEWADSRPGGYLTDITAEILAVRDADTGGYLLDRISDVAGQKGTGSWTVEAALAYGVPIPTIMEAVAARQLSGHRAGRRTVQGDSAPASEAPQSLIDDLETALLASMTTSLHKGLDLYAVAAAEHHWQPDLTSLLKVWRAGSILRCRQLEVMIEAISDGTSWLPASLMPGWRRAVGAAISAALPVPALAASLGYADALSAEVLPTALIQVQRDRFGDHGFRRTDRPGTHHGPWSDGNDIFGR